MSVETLRYYERRGLLEAPPRSSAGYRDYPEEAVRVVRFVRRGQRLGFTLEELSELLQLASGGPESCGAARGMAARRMVDLESRVADLERMRESLSRLVDTCDRPHGERECPLLDSIEEAAVRIDILHVADCPGVPLLDERLPAALAGRSGVRVVRRLVADEIEARAWGMTGSPTVLVDGVDPFADGPLRPSLSCRLYEDEDGGLAPAPSAARLRAVLAREGSELVRDVSDLAGPIAMPVRQAGLPRPVRELHRAVLRWFVDRGVPPDRSWLEERAAGLGVSGAEVVAALARADLVHWDSAGVVAVAYPFSGVPTGCRVRLAGGPEVEAMCAVDALGIPAMAGLDAVIDAMDPGTGESVRVEVVAGRWAWSPASAVVVVARSAEGGPSSCCTCPHINFHASTTAAERYLRERPELAGEVLDQDAAVRLGAEVFGPLLRADNDGLSRST